MQIDKVTRSILPTQKSLLHIFIPLILLTDHYFGRHPYLWMLNGTGMGHRMTMIGMLLSILAYLRDQDHFFRQPLNSAIEGLWSYNCFVFPKYFACVTWPFYFRQPSGRNPKGCLCAKCVIFMLLSCIMFFLFVLFLFLSCKP